MSGEYEVLRFPCALWVIVVSVILALSFALH